MKHLKAKSFQAVVIILAAAYLGGCNSSVKESTDTWQQPFWSASDESDGRAINHSNWDRVLKTYVVSNHPSKINRFRYADVSNSDRKVLAKYVNGLSQLDPRAYRKSEQKAYWVNLYNALVVQKVLGSYPIDSVSDMPNGDIKVVTVAGKNLSLNDIEHRVLRPNWKDHRIHFALVDGSLGAPNLQPRAYTGRNIRSMLKSAGREYLNHPRGLQFEKGKMRASKVFADHPADFAKNQAGLLKLFAYYVDDRKALYLLGFQGEIEYHQDLALNAP